MYVVLLGRACAQCDHSKRLDSHVRDCAAQAMIRAQHSIAILGWELSFTFGLALVSETPTALRPTLTHHSSKWITIEDVLLARALAGVRVRIIVWRHSMVNYVNKYAATRCVWCS